MASNDHSPLPARLRTTTIDRRHLVGGAAGVATAATAALALGSFVSAQTPDPTPESGSDASSSSATTSLTDRSAAIIASVQADRDALASSFDTATIDELLSLANDLQAKAVAAAETTSGGSRRDGASTAATPASTTATPAASDGASTASSPGKRRLALAAVRTARAARATLVAQLADFGLPSQQARVSRGLAGVYDGLVAVADDASTAGSEDASALVTGAEDAYTSAYEAYTAATYARATAYGEAAVALAAGAVSLLGGDGSRGPFGGRGASGRPFVDWGDGTSGRGGRRGRGDRDGMAPPSSDGTTEDGDDSTPVDVPKPSF